MNFLFIVKKKDNSPTDLMIRVILQLNYLFKDTIKICFSLYVNFQSLHHYSVSTGTFLDPPCCTVLH
jgi:hypothetical protein